MALQLAALSCSLAALCSCAARNDEVVGATELPLIGGAVSGSADDAVVFLRTNHDDGSFADCTATLVSPHVAVTVKHCITQMHEGDFVCSGNGELIRDGTGAGVIGVVADPERMELHTGVVPNDAIAAVPSAVFATQANEACRDDVAVLVLDRAVTAPYYFALRRNKPTSVGETVRLLGYGRAERPSVERREIVGVRVVDVNGDDGPDDETATTPRRTFVTEGGTSCSGDSGGPALASDSATLVGIYSRISGDCYAKESRNTFMLAASYAPLIDRALDQAGESAAAEPVSMMPEYAPPAAAPSSQKDAGGAFNCALAGARGRAPAAAALASIAALAWFIWRRCGASSAA